MRKNKFLASIVFITAFICVFKIAGTSDFVFAQSATSAPQQSCVGREAQCRAELDKVEKEIAQWQAVLKTKQGETASLARDAAILNAQIQQAKLVIKAHNLSITSLGKDIDQKQKTIETLEEKIDRGKVSLSQLIRKTNELDSYTVPEMMLSNQNLSGFFADLDSFDSIKRSLEDLFTDIRKTQGETNVAKEVLTEKKNQEIDTRVAVETTKKKVEVDEAEKRRLINISKTQEKTYAQVVLEKQQKAAQIRSALFPLRDSAAIPFGEALTYAVAASKQTSVRPALILAILQQESNLGANVGSCVITNLTTGETKSINSGKLFSNGIHPTRDLPLLQSIVRGLGRDPVSTKVSCPYLVGYGGAMGPTQFIPSTWEIIKGKVSSALGKAVPDPWDPEDSIWAAAFLLSGNGANGGTFTTERTSACKYYSGKTCYNTIGQPNVGLTYGNQVMVKAQTIQTTMIDPLSGL